MKKVEWGGKDTCKWLKVKSAGGEEKLQVVYQGSEFY